jgi:hypothetical protein
MRDVLTAQLEATLGPGWLSAAANARTPLNEAAACGVALGLHV